jgi:hypothetical protein
MFSPFLRQNACQRLVLATLLRFGRRVSPGGYGLSRHDAAGDARSRGKAGVQ